MVRGFRGAVGAGAPAERKRSSLASNILWGLLFLVVFGLFLYNRYGK
jgi:hypothetical protein